MYGVKKSTNRYNDSGFIYTILMGSVNYEN